MSDFDAGSCNICADNCPRFGNHCDACYNIALLEKRIEDAKLWNEAIVEAAQIMKRASDDDKNLFKYAEQIRALKKTAKMIVSDFK